MTIGYDMTVSIEYQISSQYSKNISVTTTMVIITNKTKNPPSPPVVVPDTVTENSPSFMENVGEFFSSIGNGLVAAGEEMMNFATKKSRFGYAIYYRFFTDSRTTICISLIYL